MKSNSTAKAMIRVRGPDISYGLIRMTPQIDSREHSIEVESFSIRKGNDRYSLSDIPLSRVLPQNAKEDILYTTFEADDEERSEYLEVDFEIPDYDEFVRMMFRAIEGPGGRSGEIVTYEVEDPAGDWIRVEDMLFIDMLGDSFMRTLESSVVENMSSHTLDRLPMSAES